MAFETQSVNIQTKKILGVGEFAVETKISLDLEKPLKRVLSVKALADVSSCEQIDADYTMLGKTQINVLYLTENNTLESVMGYADWQNSVKVVGEVSFAQVSVKEVIYDAVSSNEIGISVLHNVYAHGISKDQITTLVNLPEDYVCNKAEVCFNQVKASSTSKFVVTDNIDMPNALQILNSSACVKVKSVTSGIDLASVEGEIDVKLFYATADGTNTLTKTLDFKQEVSCLGAVPSDLSSANVYINSITSTLEFADKTNLVLAVGLCAQADVYESKNLQVVTDVFSLSKKLETTTEYIDYTTYLNSNYYNDTVVCNAVLDKDNVDELVSVINPTVELSYANVLNGKLNIEGVVKSTVVYKDNQAETTNSYNMVCPFISRIDTDISGGINNININCNLSNTKLRSGKEIEIVVALNISCDTSAETYFDYIKNINEVGPKEEQSSAITIYVTKENESLYSVAKALNVLPETITSQNEVIDNKFASGQRVFVYSPLNIQF